MKTWSLLLTLIWQLHASPALTDRIELYLNKPGIQLVNLSQKEIESLGKSIGTKMLKIEKTTSGMQHIVLFLPKHNKTTNTVPKTLPLDKSHLMTALIQKLISMKKLSGIETSDIAKPTIHYFANEACIPLELKRCESLKNSDFVILHIDTNGSVKGSVEHYPP